MRPLLFGYQGPLPVENRLIGAVTIAQFAAREGYNLAGVYAERPGEDAGLSALAEMLEAMNRLDVMHVVVPGLHDLGRLPRVRSVVRRRMECGGEAVVHVLGSEANLPV